MGLTNDCKITSVLACILMNRYIYLCGIANLSEPCRVWVQYNAAAYWKPSSFLKPCFTFMLLCRPTSAYRVVPPSFVAVPRVNTCLWISVIRSWTYALSKTLYWQLHSVQNWGFLLHDLFCAFWQMLDPTLYSNMLQWCFIFCTLLVNLDAIVAIL